MGIIKLSIIIPAYNAEPWIHVLMERLNDQMTDEVEVILIDDGSDRPLHFDYPWLKSYRQTNKGISKTRNRGLEMARGEIIAFLDADDMVSENYISYILSRADEDWDYMDLSWRSLEDGRYLYKLNSDQDALSNPSACTRVFRRSFIGDVRFPEKKDASEDEHFTRRLGLKNAKHICATDFLYFYRVTTPNSNSKQFLKGIRKTKRIAYFFNHVTADMTYLIEEFKKEDEINEVFLLTYQNDIPELEKYCRIWNPREKGSIGAMEKRGEPTRLINIMPTPLQCQLVIYTSYINDVGGVETFCYNFCKVMSKYFDIVCLYDQIDPRQLARFQEVVKCVKNDPGIPVVCDTLIVNRLMCVIPDNISYVKSIQMVHGVKQNDSWKIPKDRDYIVNVSEVSKNSFGSDDGIVIHNLTLPEKVDRALLLVSTIRVGASDKQGNDARCVKFARMLSDSGIPYVWLYFGNQPIANALPEMKYMGVSYNIKPYIKMADYLVLLSGAEAYSYSLLEALELHTPVIVTPLDQNDEMGIDDGVNGYIVPFEVDGFDMQRLRNIPTFTYKHDNAAIIKQWKNLIGKSKPLKEVNLDEVSVVRIIKDYNDMELNRIVKAGEVLLMPKDRASLVSEKGMGVIIG